MMRIILLCLAVLMAAPSVVIAQHEGPPEGTATQGEGTEWPATFVDYSGTILFSMRIDSAEFRPFSPSATQEVQPVASPEVNDVHPPARTLTLHMTMTTDRAPETAGVPVLIATTGFGKKPAKQATSNHTTTKAGASTLFTYDLELTYELGAEVVADGISWSPNGTTTLFSDISSLDPQFSPDLPIYRSVYFRDPAMKFAQGSSGPQAEMRLLVVARHKMQEDPFRNTTLLHQHYVYVMVEITNCSDEPFEVRSDEFYLPTGRGVTYRPQVPVPDGPKARAEFDDSTKVVEPGETITVTLFIPFGKGERPTGILWFQNGSWTILTFDGFNQP